MRYILLLFILVGSVCRAVTVDSLTLEEKVGQLLMVHVLEEQAGEEAKLLVQEAHVGGIIYFRAANGLTGPDQVYRLSKGLQSLASIPLFIAIDNEGAITHLKKGFTYFPSNWAIGRTKNPENARLCAYSMAQQLKAVGINMNLAPVVDVNSNPLNPVIGIRAFSDRPEEVALYGQASLQGYKEAGLISCLKHFPGHGDVAVDSHRGLPVSNKSLVELESSDLYPFQRLVNQAEVIMTAHLVVPALDPHRCASLSRPILQDLLRDKMGFTGLVISDSLVMDAIQEQSSSLEEAAEHAFNAGCDILTLAGGFTRNSVTAASTVLRVHQALITAVKEGRISEKRVNASVARILQLKAKYGLGRELVKTIAENSVETLYSHESLDGKKITIIAPELLSQELSDSKLAKHKIYYYKNPYQVDEAVGFAKASEALVLVTANAWKSSEQQEFLKKIYDANPNVFLLTVASPKDAEVLPRARAAVASYGPAPASLDAAFSLFFVASKGQ